MGSWMQWSSIPRRMRVMVEAESSMHWFSSQLLGRSGKVGMGAMLLMDVILSATTRWSKTSRLRPGAARAVQMCQCRGSQNSLHELAPHKPVKTGFHPAPLVQPVSDGGGFPREAALLGRTTESGRIIEAGRARKRRGVGAGNTTMVSLPP